MKRNERDNYWFTGEHLPQRTPKDEDATTPVNISYNPSKIDNNKSNTDQR